MEAGPPLPPLVPPFRRLCLREFRYGANAGDVAAKRHSSNGRGLAQWEAPFPGEKPWGFCNPALQGFSGATADRDPLNSPWTSFSMSCRKRRPWPLSGLGYDFKWKFIANLPGKDFETELNVSGWLNEALSTG